MSCCQLEQQQNTGPSTKSKDVVKNGDSQFKWLIRPMEADDIDECLTIWSLVKLTEARQTVASALAADPGGFYVAQSEDTGRVIGMCAGPMTREDTAFVGFYAVSPQYQGLGIGRELWATTLARLGPSTNIGLYGVPSMSDKYRRSGFEVEDTIRMLIFESHPDEQLRLDTLKTLDSMAGCRLVVVDGQTDELLFKKLLAYDQSVQRFSRDKLLRLYLQASDAPLTLALIRDREPRGEPTATGGSGEQLPSPGDASMPASSLNAGGERKLSCCARPSEASIREDETLSSTVESSLSMTEASGAQRGTPSPTGDHQLIVEDHEAGYEIVGYGCIRDDNNSGGMIGPIYADSSEICEVLLGSLISKYELKSGSIFSIMALSSNKHASRILTKVGFNEMEQCSRMFTKFVPAASYSRIYFVHSPNFTLF